MQFINNYDLLIVISLNLFIFFLIKIFIKNNLKLPIGSIFFIVLFIFLYYKNNFFINNINSLFIILFLWLIGILDDIYNLKISIRFLLTFLLVSLFLYINIDMVNLELNVHHSFNFLIFLILILGFMHMMNMIDGIDGNYIFYVILIFIFFTLIEATLFNISILLTSFFFLILNLNKKIIIGNSGNYLISFIIAFCLNLNKDLQININNIILSEHFVLILFLFPLIDGIWVSIKRMLSNKSPFAKDNSHIHLINKNSRKTLYFLSFLQIITILIYIWTNLFILTFFIGICLYITAKYVLKIFKF